jgi:hypothetical protein
MLGYLAMGAAAGLDIQLSRPTGNLSRDDVASNRNIAELLGHFVPRHLQGYHVHATGDHQERGWSMTEQVPEDLTEAEVVDRLEAGRSEDEGDGASEVDRWEDEGGHDRAG